MLTEVTNFYQTHEKYVLPTINHQIQVNQSFSYEHEEFLPKLLTMPKIVDSYDIDIIEEICNKYFISLSQEDLSRLLIKVQKIRETQTKKKNHSVTAAAVLFIQYSDKFHHRMTKDFCRRNNLNTRRFNECFKKYHRMFLKGLKTDSSQENDEIICSRVERGQKQFEGMGPFEALSQSDYFQDNRRQIIEKLVEHYNEIDPITFEKMNWTKNGAQKAYYVFFYLLKDLKYQMPFHIFKGIIKFTTNMSLKKQQMDATFKIIDNLKHKKLKISEQSIDLKLEHF